MQDYGTVMEQMERVVYHAESGLYSRVLMEAIIYRQPRAALVLMRSTLTPNVTDAIDSYTVISGDTLEEWKKNMEESDLMPWKPLPPLGSGLDLNWN